jgi:hypothetical protein
MMILNNGRFGMGAALTGTMKGCIKVTSCAVYCALHHMLPAQRMSALCRSHTCSTRVPSSTQTTVCSSATSCATLRSSRANLPRWRLRYWQPLFACNKRSWLCTVEVRMHLAG